MTVRELIEELRGLDKDLTVHTGEEYDYCDHWEVDRVVVAKKGDSIGGNGAITAKEDLVFLD